MKSLSSFRKSKKLVSVEVQKTVAYFFMKFLVPESPTRGSAKEAGMIILKIKRVKRVAVRPANSLQPLPVSVLGKRKVGDLSIGYVPCSNVCLGCLTNGLPCCHPFRSFGQEVKAYDQYDTTWEVTAYDEDTPGAKPSTYVSFIFRYRSPGGWLVLSVLNKV